MTPTIHLHEPEQFALTFDDWSLEGERLRDRVEALEWDLGDWLLRGANAYGKIDALERANAIFRRDGRKPRLIMETCRAFPPERRDLSIGFSHYVEVRALPAPDAEAILDQVRIGAHTVAMTKGAAKNLLHERQGTLHGVEDPDVEDKAYRMLVQAWNNAPRSARQMLSEQIEETGLGVIDL